jgi:hypothetical protein
LLPVGRPRGAGAAPPLTTKKRGSISASIQSIEETAMSGTTPLPRGAVRWVSVVDPLDGRRCPNCGSGDLFEIRLLHRGGGERLAAYCAGLYDRDRRRLVRRSCGYAEGEAAAGSPA